MAVEAWAVATIGPAAATIVVVVVVMIIVVVVGVTATIVVVVVVVIIVVVVVVVVVVVIVVNVTIVTIVVNVMTDAYTALPKPIRSPVVAMRTLMVRATPPSRPLNRWLGQRETPRLRRRMARG